MLLLLVFLIRRYNGGLFIYGVKFVERFSNVFMQVVFMIFEGWREEVDEVEVDFVFDFLQSVSLWVFCL